MWKTCSANNFLGWTSSSLSFPFDFIIEQYLHLVLLLHQSWWCHTNCYCCEVFQPLLEASWVELFLEGWKVKCHKHWCLPLQWLADVDWCLVWGEDRNLVQRMLCSFGMVRQLALVILHKLHWWFHWFYRHHMYLPYFPRQFLGSITHLVYQSLGFVYQLVSHKVQYEGLRMNTARRSLCLHWWVELT